MSRDLNAQLSGSSEDTQSRSPKVRAQSAVSVIPREGATCSPTRQSSPSTHADRKHANREDERSDQRRRHHHHQHHHHRHHNQQHSQHHSHQGTLRRLQRSHSSSAEETTRTNQSIRYETTMLSAPSSHESRESGHSKHTSTHEAGSCYPSSATTSSHRSCSSAPLTTSSAHKSGSIPHPGPVNCEYRERGDALVHEAEAKLSRSLFRSGDERGALECYQRAAAQYKLAGDWGRAATIMEIMAKIFKNQGDLSSAARLYGEAGTCHRKVSPKAAVDSYLRSAELYIEMGKFSIPAKHHEAIALIYSKDVSPPEYGAVLHHLGLAASYYYSDNRRAARNKCRLEMARLFALSDRFQEAILIYEELGFESLDSRMLKYSADEYLFRAALCHLCVDSLNCEIALKRYVEYYPAFTVSREFKFLQSLCEEVEHENEEGVDMLIRKYRSLLNSDPWFLSMLGRIQETLPGASHSLR